MPEPPADRNEKDTNAALAGTMLEQTLQAHDIALDSAPGDTVGRLPPTLRFAARSPLETLPRVTVVRAADAADEADYVVASELGGGGMGVVELAAQVALERDVAMKRARSPKERRVALSLLHEARITGHLEHPNIVPVHAVGMDSSRGPVVVMKCVRGTPWSELIAKSETPLERHLEILMQVCNAVAFAHSKHIVHCDLKPPNVMVGEFGAVYLVDWGIAVKRDAPGSDRPRGTPAYMAPELVVGLREHIDERSDVYLLGACLHEALTGRPRHDGGDLMEVLRTAIASEAASYADDVPHELAAICNRACHLVPTDRYASAQALRDALQGYLDDRSAYQLIDEAASRLQALRNAVERAHTSTSDENDQQVRALFRESQFAFEHVRKTRPGLSAAAEGLQQSLEVMFRYEIAVPNRRAAEALVQAMAQPPEQVGDDLAELQRADDEEKGRLAKLIHASDAGVAAAERRRLGKIFVGLGILVIAAVFLLKPGLSPTFSHFHVIKIALVMWLVVVGATLAARKRLFANEYNRRRIQLPLSLVSAMLAYRVMAWWVDAALSTTMAMEPLMLAPITAMAGQLSRVYYLAAALLVAASLIIAWQPMAARLVILTSYLAVCTLMVWQWRTSSSASSDKAGART